MCFATLGIIGAATSALGALYGGVATSEASSYQAQVSRNNALIANQNAVAATQAGQEQAAQQSLKNAGQLGQIKTAIAANNINVNSGSSVDVLASQREIGQLDTEETLQRAQQQAYGYRVASTSATAQAGLQEEEAQTAPVAAGLTAAGGLATATSKLPTNWVGGT